MPDKSAHTVANALLSRWGLFIGAHRRRLKDKGAKFKSGTVQNLCSLYQNDKVRTTASHPAGNAGCEIPKQTITRGLQKILNEKRLEEWAFVLSEVSFAKNICVPGTTVFTPYFLMFGLEARIVSEILVGLPEMERTPAAYAFQRYPTFGGA